MRGFDFKKPIDVDNPLDPNDLPPVGHDQVDTSDYRKSLFGFAPTLMRECDAWEKRELERYSALATTTVA